MSEAETRAAIADYVLVDPNAEYIDTDAPVSQVHHFHPRFARFEGVRAFGINNLDTRFAEFV